MNGRRAAWEPAMEQALMELFEKAREDSNLRTGRGIKARAWSDITTELNTRYKTSLFVEQLKSKYARLMMDYDLFKDIGGEEGSLSEEQWKAIIAARPENASRIRQFKEHGCAYVDVCRRIAATREEGKEGMPLIRKLKAERKPRMKRATSVMEAQAPLKKARTEDVGWTPERVEELLLFLYWKAKNDEEGSKEEELTPQGWANVLMELNNVCSATFTEQEIKDKYVKLIERYHQFKHATGFSGDLASIPKDEMDWERLIRERPGHYTELEELKDLGGFPYVEVCSLITGDTLPHGMGTINVSDFLATGVLQLPTMNAIPSQPQSANAIASAQASLSANALSYLLPATTSLVTSMATNGQQGPAGSVKGGSGATAVFSQELHDNLNMFLKTATAYLVMLINDHNSSGAAAQL
ncbi:hypothetical protein CCR75_000916 [Bremia lactucae]|uniref:Myb/SANT-like domain-containing protein n=1 Tax=Bremia lactucae TaxID=4779 RepID=A0A976FKW1_BRELC|nr:hypothetical protein CCR75_000916 [Bremia lactucae]